MRVGSGLGARRVICGLFASAVVALVGAGVAQADTALFTFENPPYTLGSIDGQDGWSSTGPYDHEVSASYGIASFGAQSLRLSNAVTSGAFGDQTFSRSLADEAGEASAASDGFSGGTRQSSFEATWSFASTVPGAEQPGLSVVASPDRGDGARMSWVQMRDTAAGLEVNFNDYQAGVGFVMTNVATGLSRSTTHTVKLTMFFVDGPANDIVKVCVDGTSCHTGTSWEDYFRNEELNPTRTVDSLLFRTGGDAAPATLGNGFVVDNLTIGSSNTSPTACVFTTTGTTMTLTADCTTDQTIVVPQGFTLDGDGNSITAVDPAGDHFRGAVVKNGGTVAHVTDVEITAAGLADVCDGGPDRLRGILIDDAAGSITNVNVHGVRQGLSGCQEGNAIEVRNFAPAPTVRSVTIADNVVTDYQKAGIVVNGTASGTITGNVVTGDGPIGYIAQNGIQVGFGGSGFIRENTVSGNYYAPADTVACGLLFFEAAGVKQQANTLFANEVNLCNFKRGGGNPSS